MIEEAVKEMEENVKKNIDKSLIEVVQELQAENDKLKNMSKVIITDDNGDVHTFTTFQGLIEYADTCGTMSWLPDYYDWKIVEGKPAKEMKEDEVEVLEIEFKGSTYWVGPDNTVLYVERPEPRVVGTWNADEKRIIFH